VPRPTSHPFHVDRDPPVSPGEASLLDAAEAALR
jgi:hypothetical protein